MMTFQETGELASIVEPQKALLEVVEFQQFLGQENHSWEMNCSWVAAQVVVLKQHTPMVSCLDVL